MIDRRIFLQLSGGAAASSAALGVVAPRQAESAVAERLSSPLSGVQVGDGVSTALADPLRILNDRLVAVTDGRLMLRADASSPTAGVRPDSVILANEGDFAASEPLSLLLGGYPFHPHAAMLDFTVWLRGMGGQVLWDRSAARYDWKPLMVGCVSRTDTYVWYRRQHARAAGRDDFRVAAPGVLTEPLRQRGGVPVPLAAAELIDAFEAGNIDAFESSDPAISLSAAERLGNRAVCYLGSLAGTKRVISLRIPLAKWQALPTSDQALLELVAQDTVTRLHAVGRAHSAEFDRLIERVHGQKPQRVPMDIRNSLTVLSDDALASVGRGDPYFMEALASMKMMVGGPYRRLGDAAGAPSA